MKLLFLQQEPLAHLGFMSLAAFLEGQGHRCRVLIEELEKNVGGAVRDYPPDLAGYYGYAGNAEKEEGGMELLSRDWRD